MKRTKPLVEWIAQTLQARENCRVSGNQEWFRHHTANLRELEQFLPAGSGIDHGTQIDLTAFAESRICLITGFHHMHESGMYDGWTDHIVTVRPAFVGRFSLGISGRNRNDIKEYLYQLFDHALSQMIEVSADGMRIAEDTTSCAKN
jgi:hypothetical protein